MDKKDQSLYREAEKRLFDHYALAPREHFLRLPALGKTVRVLQTGGGPPLLFIHGSPNASPKWVPLAARLPDFTCLLLDRPGCGLSEPVDYNGLDLRAFASDLLGGTLDALGLAAAPLVASSMGGALAIFFAAAHPTRVPRLVLEGCPALVKGFRVPLYNVIGSVRAMLTGRAGPSLAGFRQMGHSAAIDAGRFHTPVLTWRDALLRHTRTGPSELALERHLLPRMKAYTYDESLLARLSMPTLYLWGEADPFGSADLGRRMAAAQPDARFQSFPASGHLPWLDDPEAHAAVIRAFL